MKYFSIMGFGTTLYGEREKNPDDNSYVTTGWFTLFFLPIFPIASYRVVLGTQQGIYVGAQVKYQTMEPIPLSGRQVINTYLLWSPLYAFALFTIWLNFNH